MKFLESWRWRVFLVAWIVYSAHFTTNVVREHYPAFSLAEHGTFLVDEYQGFHPDIFEHNGHSVIGNQVFVSTLAAIPLWIFDPVLDALERHSKARLASAGVENAEYRTNKPLRQVFFRRVKEAGLDLRFGAATVITTVFFMAPLTALFLVYFYSVLRQRGIEDGAAAGLALFLGFGTPIFFRTTGLNHNMFVMYSMFGAFVLLWVQPGQTFPVSLRRRLLAGLFGGLTLATDYIGVIILPLLWGYLFIPRLSTASWKVSLRETLPMIAAAVPPVLFLLYSQWSMYGNPFLPGQFWMPEQNIYVNEGLRGFKWPALDLILQNLFDPAFGMYVWGPLMLLALVPTTRYASDALVLPRRERRFVALCFISFLLFCSANQYARLQFNSGFRYLIPLVPFLFLALVDHWIRMPRPARVSIAVAAIVHSWVLTVFREPVPVSWRLFLSEGLQLPWFRVLRMTSATDNPWLQTSLVPAAILGVMGLAVLVIWRRPVILGRSWVAGELGS